MNYKNIHIIGIGGCASSAIAEFLHDKKILVTGSDMVKKSELDKLENKGITIRYTHKKENIYINGKPDIVLYSPAIVARNPNNPEYVEAIDNGIPTESWEEFIGKYLKSQGGKGVTVSGSEGKGTTAGILTSILMKTKFDPLSILGAKLKSDLLDEYSNIYCGEGNTYILEGDEYNRNFLHYHPDINVMINFEYEHPETYKNFDEYSIAFNQFFKGMSGSKKLILRVTKNIIDFVNKYGFTNVTWFGRKDDIDNLKPNGKVYCIDNEKVDSSGNSFELNLVGSENEKFYFEVPALPGYITLNATGAILAAMELGLEYSDIVENIKRFKGMVRRFDLFKTEKEGVFITDYGHSPGAVGFIISEIKSIFNDKKIHIVFQPHLFTRTYNFFNEFVEQLSLADKITILDIYPARENIEVWSDKVNSKMLCDALKEKNSNVSYAGQSKNCAETLFPLINASEVTCFLGAGDMDLYYNRLFEKFNVVSWF